MTTEADENFETYSLLWLDAAVNDSNQNLQAQKKLRQTINHLKTFEDVHLCMRYILSLNNHDRIVLIVNGKLGKLIVPKIVHLRQIISIYVYCYDLQTHQQWAKLYSKVWTFYW